MLYVFQVDTGLMMNFDMSFAMDTVAQLKRAISMKTDFPEEKLVLLVSGGESLNNLQRVCSYSSAGTDTSPIFLFTKVNIESNQPPILPDNLPDAYANDDANITEMIESCMSMQPSLDTLVARTELAADLNKQATNQKEICERLVHDQHLQQQGWAAVNANLDDLTRAFKNKAEMLITAFKEFVNYRSTHEELLNRFNDDLKYLQSIPILPTLIESNKLINLANITSTDATTSSMHISQQQQSTLPSSKPATTTSSSNPASISKTKTTTTTTALPPPDNQSDYEVTGKSKTSSTSVTVKQSTTATGKILGEPTTSADNVVKQQLTGSDDSSSMSLRSWIDYHDSQNSLERLVELCWRGLERYTEANAEQIKLEVQELVKAANNNSMKEIKGLEERLFGLEKLMVDAKKVVDEQSQLAASFQNNKERFSKIKDSTLLPDLSASHKEQLQMMLRNHTKMSDYRSRCLKAKCELSVNLNARLKWIMYIEQQISELDGKLMIYKENLLRLNRHFEIVEQVHRSPDLYLESVIEALRRRRFSRRYLHWANSIAKISQELYETEMTIRRDFDSKLNSHFLSNLFPGLTRSYPPPFATVQPDSFDTKLPRVTASDIQYLQANLTKDLSEKLHIPKDLHLPHLIASNLDAAPIDEIDDDDDRHSLNPTPPSSPTRQEPDIGLDKEAAGNTDIDDNDDNMDTNSDNEDVEHENQIKKEDDI